MGEPPYEARIARAASLSDDVARLVRERDTWEQEAIEANELLGEAVEDRNRFEAAMKEANAAGHPHWRRILCDALARSSTANEEAPDA